MKARLLYSLLIALGLLIVISQVESSWNSALANSDMQNEIQKIQEEIDKLEGSEADQKRKRDELQKEMAELERQRELEEDELRKVVAEISINVERKVEKEEEISGTEDEFKITTDELKEVEERVAEREELLQTRLLAMYESGGNSSYLEVLLGSSSFADFFQRLEFLNYIAQQDRGILEEHERDKALVEEKKDDLENLLVKLDTQLGELEQIEERLREQERQQQVTIATISEKYGQLETLDEEMQDDMLEIANQASELLKQQQGIQAELRRIEEERRQRQQQASGPSSGGGELGWPVQGYRFVTDHFGWRDRHPVTGGGRPHNGIDLRAPTGTNLLAAESGIIAFAGWMSGYGNTVIIDHGGGMRTLYAHLSRIGKSGGSVSRGEIIGQSGATGAVTAPHLHFEVHINGTPVNPAPKYIRP